VDGLQFRGKDGLPAWRLPETGCTALIDGHGRPGFGTHHVDAVLRWPLDSQSPHEGMHSEQPGDKLPVRCLETGSDWEPMGSPLTQDRGNEGFEGQQ
jgi:hypothetical protein